MDETEYERRKRALEQIYLADLELVQAAHAARMRSLETLRTSTEAPAANPPAVVAPVQPAAPPPPPAVQRPDLRTAIEEIFDQLPTVFEKNDVSRALGWTPNRSSLQRVLGDLRHDGLLEFLETSGGRVPSRYRKT